MAISEIIVPFQVGEVQTKGSIDCLIVNLLKSLNNPAVQGVVAVSDKEQLEKIRGHAEGVTRLRDKLKLMGLPGSAQRPREPGVCE